MIVFSDLHLKPSTEDVCFRVLEEIEQMALDGGHRVVCCGDFWHIRYALDVRLLNRVAALMVDWSAKGIELDMVPGNHDQVDVNGVNALEVIEAVHQNCLVWTEPGVEQSGKFGFCPYRKDPAEQLAALEIAAAPISTQPGATRPSIIFGHFGMEGATMNSGRVAIEGVGRAPDQAHLVLGHYHKRQQGKGWEYVGSPYQTSFGEEGNVCGVMVIDQETFAREWVPLDVGAPKHYILKWDPAKDSEPPAAPGVDGNHVRLDIEASHEMIVSGKFKGVLASAGLADVEINVIPTKVSREHKFALRGGETLLDAAERFAQERLTVDGVRELEVPMAALRRWAGV